MPKRHWSRRDVLKTSTALAAGVLFAEPVRAAAPPPPTSVTPELIEAARKEGKLSYYSALELNTAVKPYVFRHFLSDGQATSATYLDPQVAGWVLRAWVVAFLVLAYLALSKRDSG